MRCRVSLFVSLILAAACGGTPPVDAVWSMPASSSEERRGGQPFVAPGVRGAGADVATERGDLPESVARRHGSFWREDEAEAVAEARASGRGIFIDFYADWCAGCLTLEAETYSDLRVRQRLQERYVPLRIDVTEPTRRDREQLERFRIYQLPAIILLTAEGSELARFDEPLEPELLIDRLEAARPEAPAR